MKNYKYQNSFSLIEVITGITIITLCIISLMSVYYSIYKLQNYTMYNNLLQRKAETMFFTKIFPIFDEIYKVQNYNYIEQCLKNALNYDQDIDRIIYISEINFTLDYTNTNVGYITLQNTKTIENNRLISFKEKTYAKLIINYKIIKTKKENTLIIFFPILINNEKTEIINQDSTNESNLTTRGSGTI